MLAYTVRRLFIAIPTLLLIITLSFAMVRIAPGGPFDAERNLPPEIMANLEKAYHLDKPLGEQYVRYLAGIVRGDFGPSYRYRDFTVTELIRTGFPVSLRLGSLAILLGLIIGLCLGCIAAVRQNSHLDYCLMGMAMTGITVPNFIMAPILTLIFGVYLHWLPVGGWGNGALKNMVLPVAALALPQIAYIARLTRGSMVEVLRSDYIRTARAKGLPERLILTRHALKGALLPVVTYLGPATAGIITGSVVIEQIFDLPGIGRYFVQGALNRDYTLVMGVVIFFSILIIVLNLLVDIAYGFLDPKIRYE
jgi:oligopeptide transport system permease protein